MILVIDLGTQSFRATVIDRHGRPLSESSTPIATHRDGPVAEQDPLQWRAALLLALERFGSLPIRAVTASATLSGLVCLDANGHPLRPAILYGDRRPASQLPAIEASPAYLACPFRAYSGDFLPQLHYLRSAEPHHFHAAQYLLDATGYLNFLLTTEATLDRYTTLTCYGDPTPEFPAVGRIVDPGEIIGRAPALSNAPVICVSYDSAAAYLGTALNQPGEALDISGTVTSFGVLAGRQIIDPHRRIFSIPYHGNWLVRGSTAMSGPVLDWAKDTLGDGSFSSFDTAVLQSPPGANGVTFLPFLAGARSPIWDPSASGTFHGITSQTTKADLARAVYEGLCFALLHIIATIESCGAPVHSIQLAGGLSRNPLLNQLKADITGKPVLPQQSTEVTTLGSATIAARVLGWLGPNDSFCATAAPLTPQNHHAFLPAFRRYNRLIDSLYS